MRYLLADELKGFMRQYPNIELSISVSEALVNLDLSEADVVMRTSNSPPSHLVGRRLFPYAVSYYSDTDYFMATDDNDLSWIGMTSDDTSDWLLNTPYPDARIGLRTKGHYLRHLAVLAGLGMARGACFMADQEPALKRLPNNPVFDALDFWVLTHPDLRASPRVKVVMNFLADTLISKRDLIQGKTPNLR